MKNFILLFSLFIGLSAVAQNKKVVDADIQVEGVCDQCKKRIENAAYIKGVKRVEYSIETHNLCIFYDSTKTSLTEIEQSVSLAGHATENIPADEKAYSNLPKCCAYKSGETHNMEH